MRVSAKADYALRALIEIAARTDEGAVSADQIGKAQDIPHGFLQAILADLRRSDIVVSQRGQSGGWRFARTPSSVTVADGASRRFSVVEVQAADRAGLLAALGRAIMEADVVIQSAHIATYGERAVDVFYLAGAGGRKLSADEIARLRPALLAAASQPFPNSAAA